MNRLLELEERVSALGAPKTLALAACEDANALKALMDVRRAGWVRTLLFGDAEKTRRIAQQEGIGLEGVELEHHPEPEAATAAAARAVASGRAQVLMKGKVATASLLRAVLDKGNGLSAGGLLSHLALFELPAYPKLLALTDAAMNIAPSLREKAAIVQNAVAFLRHLGYELPLVAALAAVETVSDKMPATLEAAALAMMNRRGQIPGCLLDGPLALDNAVSPESARHKGIESPVAGRADLLLFPSIESGNAVYKSLSLLAGGRVAAVILGAKCPIVLTSRADSEDAKRMSILLALA